MATGQAWLDGVKVVDADTHMTERHDLWTSRAPAAYKDRVPHVEQVDGEPHWVVDGTDLKFAGGGGVVDPEGGKSPFVESLEWPIEQVHPGAWDAKARLQVMDQCGIHAQVIFPNTIGLGGQDLSSGVMDPVLRQMCIEIYNDAMAEMQAESGNRFLPMPVMPAWDVNACVKEAERVAGMGMRGVNMTSDPQDLGAPDLANPAWDPFWSACDALHLPVHFHIGASHTAMTFYGNYFWESQHEYVKPAVGGSMLFINNARVVINIIFSGLLDRHPGLELVSVESGIGWVPFILETMDYELEENAPEQFRQLKRKPSEYFGDHWYATFWFERAQGDVQGLVDKVGEDNILFETDFPHPTCLYPDPLTYVAEKMETLRPSSRRKIMGDNAAKLYRL
ncbi:MAG TPA: amidohydrolase family protein [Acidimicrobiales bacterium]|nr:amidohydrolase family protein [Acidimicrobiales bacterium]